MTDTNHTHTDTSDSDTADIAKAECLACGHSTTDPLDLELWNGYGDCPKCLTTGYSRWTLLDGTVVVAVPEDDDLPACPECGQRTLTVGRDGEALFCTTAGCDFSAWVRNTDLDLSGGAA